MFSFVEFVPLSCRGQFPWSSASSCNWQLASHAIVSGIYAYIYKYAIVLYSFASVILQQKLPVSLSSTLIASANIGEKVKTSPDEELSDNHGYLEGQFVLLTRLVHQQKSLQTKMHPFKYFVHSGFILSLIMRRAGALALIFSSMALNPFLSQKSCHQSSPGR